MKHVFAAGVAVAALTAAPAQALTFDLVDYNGSVRGTPAEIGFRIATDYWASVLTNDVTVRLEIGYNALAANVIGSTGSTRYRVATTDIYEQLAATGDSRLDAIAVANLMPLTSAGGLQAITSGYRNDATKVGIDTTKRVFDADDTLNNTTMGVNGAALKALGFTGFPAATRDAQVNFSSNFAFDFDPSDGITAGRMDFIGVAIHEIGHALGFTSGVDIYDNPGNAAANINGSGAIFTTLDLFRYSQDPTNVVPGSGPVLDLAVGSPAYFSIDGGYSQLFGDSRFSTGRNFGDRQQASHFKDKGGCTNQIGIMDPNFCFSQMGEVTATDLAAFDAIGWNLNFDVLANSSYLTTSADIYRVLAPVPEPTTWAMMLVGFGLVGGAIRYGRRRTTVRFAAA
ncbi:NF038122 family metalloprotease [Sphingomonas mollis]|uniref:NF038122 family metalloprotease n=1 Tax=Sphingomonas mollis TaxID=2795726 RepID=A0ABS0XKC5_9SPHN|nr:NF038122 family metalloprotease [Sphingomonas sp. BT553]MBJ6120479.1 NF038122 family metalloprotease [Sphingomonas sp. BT553]